MDPMNLTEEIPGPDSYVTGEAVGAIPALTNDQLLETFDWIEENLDISGLGDANWDLMNPNEDAAVQQNVFPTISYDEDFELCQPLEAVEIPKDGGEWVDIPYINPSMLDTQHNPEVPQPFETGEISLDWSGGDETVGCAVVYPSVPSISDLSLSAPYLSEYQDQVNFQDPCNDSLGWALPPHTGYYADAMAAFSMSEAAMNAPAPTSVFASGARTPYRNEVLNSFDDAETPLRIIDCLSYPFSIDIQTALSHRALKDANQNFDVENLRQVNQEESSDNLNGKIGIFSKGTPVLQQYLPQVLPEQVGPLTLITDLPTEPRVTPHLRVPQQTPMSYRSGAATPAQKIRKNARSENIANNDPSQYYTRLAEAPESWSGRLHRHSDDPQFVYTKYGELEPTRFLSANDIATYLSDHPLHFTNDSVSTKQSGLTVWIQTVPADSNKRYPHGGSSKCRFEFCPDQHHTIRAGEYRLAFDEQHLTNGKTDPYHNAFYVHLYCMEKIFNFPQLCRDFNIVPDCRKFPEPTNRMAINRDHASMKVLCLNFIKNAPENLLLDHNPPHGWFKKSLTRRLTKEHIRKGTSHSKRKRRERGGIHIEVHLGNLDMQAEMKFDRRQGKGGLATPPPDATSTGAYGSPKKRKAREVIEIVEEDDVLDDDVLDQEYVPPLQKRMKRN